MRVLVTGANGFIGRALSRELLRRGRRVRAAVRREAELPDGCASRVVGDIGPDTDWREALEGIDAVAHLAARVHVERESAADPLAAFRRTNVAGTLQLARSAAAAGIERFIFLSSVKVLGEGAPDKTFTDSSPPDPRDPYSVSKREAETDLLELAGRTSLGVVIIRPPLVYGPGVGGNFRSLLRLIDRGVPLPIAGIANRRSLLYVGNLVDAVDLCLCHDAAAGQTYLIRDGQDLSSAELVRRLAAALGRRAPLFRVPEAALRLAARCLGRKAAPAHGPCRRRSGS